ncbi:MAG: ComEC/Rec2 family competence protein [Campylobacterota bacterium]|nr:ComEC/Rec2 family competence protein [Campylobacterota bacterium]
MRLERVALFDTRSLGLFLLAIFIIASTSLLFEYTQYRELKTFDDAEVEAQVINHYIKTKNEKTYSVLKLRFQGKGVYTIASKDLKNLRGRTVGLRVWTKRLTFLDYLKGFYIHSVLLHVKPDLALYEKARRAIASQHHNVLMQELYGALFTAAPMRPELREKLSASGTSHLLAISGFHLGVLSLILLALFTAPYRFFQERYFPYRHRHRDLFMLSAVVMLGYLIFLGFIPSLLRAFAMMLIAYFLYDRGMKVISMQTLALTVLLLSALWPTLIFSMGFWLSVSGVFYIFLFLKYFSDLKKWQIALGIAVWVYLMMLPISLYLFETFSLYHPLSILWSLLFLPFYVASLLLHVMGFGGLFDGVMLNAFQTLEGKDSSVLLSVLLLHVSVSVLAIFFKRALLFSFLIALTIAVVAVYQVT